MNALDPVRLGQNVEKRHRLFGNKFHQEVLKVLKLS